MSGYGDFDDEVEREAERLRHQREIHAAAEELLARQDRDEWLNRERVGTPLEAAFTPEEAALCRDFLGKMEARGFPRASVIQEVGVPDGVVYWQSPAYYLGYGSSTRRWSNLQGSSWPQNANLFLAPNGTLLMPGEDRDFGDLRVNQYTGVDINAYTKKASHLSIGRHEKWQFRRWHVYEVTDGSSQPDDSVHIEGSYEDPYGDWGPEWIPERERRYRRGDETTPKVVEVFRHVDLPRRLQELKTGSPIVPEPRDYTEPHLHGGTKGGLLLEVGGLPVRDGRIL